MKLDKTNNTATWYPGTNLLRRLICSTPSSQDFQMKDIVAIEPKFLLLCFIISFHFIHNQIYLYFLRKILRPPRGSARVQTKITLNTEIPHFSVRRVAMVSGCGFCDVNSFIRFKTFWLTWRMENYPEEAQSRKEEVCLLDSYFSLSLN